MNAGTGRASDQFNLRLPDGMRDRIAEAAKASGRSMNAEIVARLESSFTSEGELSAMRAALEKNSEAIRLHAERIEALARKVGADDA